MNIIREAPQMGTVYFIAGAAIAFSLVALVMNIRTNRAICRIRSGK
jgi:hypothetical protein